MARNFYGFLLRQLRQTHWATGDLRDFAEALESFVSALEDQRKHQSYLAIGEAYIEYWNRRSGELFQIPSVSVDINGLTIGVRPEVGIRIGRDHEVLKLWFNAKSPSRQARQIILHIMDMARSSSQEWRNSWNIGIWDVRRQEVPPPIRTARDFELGLAGQVAAFLQIWETLDQQAQLPSCREGGPPAQAQLRPASSLAMRSSNASRCPPYPVPPASLAARYPSA